MQMTIDEYVRKHARSTDPETSRAAAASVARGVHVQHDAIRLTLFAAQPGGLTGEEIADLIGLEMVQVCRRLSEIEGIAPTGETRATRTGRQARVWGVAP